MMAPPSLYSLAFKKVYQHIWHLSNLPHLVVDIMNKVYAAKRCNDYQVDKCDVEIVKELHKIQDSLRHCKYPFWLKVKILSAISGLNNDIVHFLVQIGAGLTKASKKKLKFSIKNIIWNQNGTINMKDTILNILKKSCLDVQFTYEFLGRHCISKDDVAIAMLDSKITNMSRPRRVVASRLTKVDRYIKGIMDIADFWAEQMRLCDKFYNGNILQYVTQWTSRADALECFYELTKEQYEKDTDILTDPEEDLQLALLEVAMASIKENFCCKEKVIFFHKMLSPHYWRIFLEKHFKWIFTHLMRSWTHRSYCMSFFTDYLDKLNVHMLRTLLQIVAKVCEDYEFQYYDVINIVQSMWEITPDALKDDHDITFALIHQIISKQADFETLVHFIKPYNDDLQKQVLGLMIFELYATSREHLVATCLKTVTQLGLEITDPRDLLNKELFKKFLSIDARSETNSYDQIKALAELLCDTEEEVSALKSDLFNDDSFCVELLSRVTFKKDLNKLLNWGLEDIQLQLFKERLIKKDLIHDIYDQRLIENIIIEDADCIFRWLKLTQKEVKLVKSRVRENMTVVHIVLLNMLETDHRLLKKHAKWLLGQDEHQIMSQVLLSSEGLTVVSEMLVKFDHSEEYMEKIDETEDASDYPECKFVYDFVNRWLRRNGLIQTMVHRYHELIRVERSPDPDTHRLYFLAAQWIERTDDFYGDPDDF